MKVVRRMLEMGGQAALQLPRQPLRLWWVWRGADGGAERLVCTGVTRSWAGNRGLVAPWVCLHSSRCRRRATAHILRSRAGAHVMCGVARTRAPGLGGAAVRAANDGGRDDNAARLGGDASTGAPPSPAVGAGHIVPCGACFCRVGRVSRKQERSYLKGAEICLGVLRASRPHGVTRKDADLGCPLSCGFRSRPIFQSLGPAMRSPTQRAANMETLDSCFHIRKTSVSGFGPWARQSLRSCQIRLTSPNFGGIREDVGRDMRNLARTLSKSGQILWIERGLGHMCRCTPMLRSTDVALRA